MCLYMPVHMCVCVGGVGVLRFMATKLWIYTCHDVVATSAFPRQNHTYSEGSPFAQDKARVVDSIPVL